MKTDYIVKELNSSFQITEGTNGQQIFTIFNKGGVKFPTSIDTNVRVGTLSESGQNYIIYKYTHTFNPNTVEANAIVCRTSKTEAARWFTTTETKIVEENGDYYLDTTRKKNIFPKLVCPDFTKVYKSVYNNEDDYFVPKYKVMGWINTNGKYFLYVEEVSVTRTFPANIKFDSPSINVKVYQPIKEINISGTYDVYTMVQNTKSIRVTNQPEQSRTFSNLKYLTDKYTLNYELPAYYIASGTFTPKLIGNFYYFERPKQALTYVVADFDTIIAKIRFKGGDYSVYVGKPLTQDICDKFELYEEKKNEYQTIKSTIYTSLDLSHIKQKYFSVEEPVIIKYEYNSQVYEYPTGKMPINLALGDEKFKLMIVKKTYNYGDVLNLRGGLNFMPENSKFVYQDGTTIPLTQLTYLGSPSATTTLNNPRPDGTYLIDENTPDFDITYHYNLKYFGKLDYTYHCIVEPGKEYAVRGELVGAKTSFNANETLEFGENAVINCYNDQNEIVETITTPFLGDGKVSQPPKGYGEIIEKICYIDTLNNRPFKVKNRFDIDWLFSVDYFDNFVINTDKVKKIYYDSGNFELDIETIRKNIVATIDKHENSVELGKISTINVDKSRLEFLHEPIEVDTGKKFYTIQVVYTDDFSNKHTQDFQITVIRVAPSKIIVKGANDTTEYYDNGQDTFHIPTGLTYEYQNNDGTFTTITEPDFNYYRTGDTSALPLEVGKSVIRPGDGTLIYIKDNIHGVIGSYTIIFKEDTINNVIFDTEAAKVDFLLGNRFVKAKDNYKINVSYISGIVKTLFPSEYDITNKEIILEPTDLTIDYKGITYNLGQSQINFIEPTLDKVELLTNGFQTTYTNKADTIDCQNIEIVVSYVDCEYKQHLTYGVEPIVGLYDKFFVKSSVKLNSLGEFNFDGSTVINTDLEGQSSVLVPLTFTFNKKYGGQGTKTFDIYVLEVLDITGLTLKNVKRTYYVGERLLNENDNTILVITFKDKNGLPKKMETKLNSGFDSVNIVPGKGTLLTTATNSYEITITSATNYNVRASYVVRVIPKISSNNTNVHNIVAVKQASYTCPKGEVITDKYLLVDEYYNDNLISTKINENGERVFNDGANTENVKVYGYIENSEINSNVILFEDYIPPVDGQNNIDVDFPCYIQGNADLINKSHLGILFGSHNTKNRLFIAGNKEKPNTDWHSAKVENGDLAYFEDTSYCNYGETDSEIVGYSIVSDNKLLVLKNYSDKDTTIWFRTPQLVQAITDTGVAQGINGEVLYQEEFSLIKGNNTVAGISPKSILNFNGDTLFLSNEKTLNGLDLVGMIGDNQRYANSRSYFIDRELERLVDKDTWLWSNNKYLALVLKDRVFLTHYETFRNKQYEWWLVDISDVQAIIERDGIIYFGNSKGQYYKINNIYSDVSKIFIGEGGSLIVSQNEDDNRIIVNKSVIEQLNENGKYTFECKTKTNDPESYMYFKIGKISNTKTGTFDFYVDTKDNTLKLYGYVDGVYSPERVNKVLNLLDETKVVYLNHYENRKEYGIETDNNSILATYYKKYYLKRFENDNLILSFNAYKLFDENGVEMDITGLLRANVCYQLNGEYQIKNIDKERSCFNIYYNDQLIDLVQYGQQPISRTFKAEIKHYKPVEAFYITKPYSMGSLSYFKTVWSFTLTNDTNIPSELNLTYANNKVPFEKMKTLSLISVDSLSFSMEDMSFKKIDFDKQIVPRTYTNERVISNLKFICFGFTNYNDTNSVLSSMSIIYSTPTQAISGD